MEFIELKDQKQLDQFVLKNSLGKGAEFLQAFTWGEIAQTAGEEILRVGATERGELLAAATLIKKPLGGGSFYWYAPRGPLGAPAAQEFLLTEIKKLSPRAVFLRLEPSEELAGLNLVKTLDLQPAKTLLLDLAKSETELLAEMHQKTRYNLNLAAKKGVKIVSGDLNNFSEFWRLMKITGGRDNFHLHAEKHYQNLLKEKQGFIKLFFAEFSGKNIAAGLFCFFGDKVTYLHGASDNEFRNIMAPHLLQWELIKIARQASYQYYDFYGIDAQKWPGVTRFKLGFGGRTFTYPGTFDLVFQPFVYCLYKLLRKLRRLI